jgi:hypothetical protein
MQKYHKKSGSLQQIANVLGSNANLARVSKVDDLLQNQKRNALKMYLLNIFNFLNSDVNRRRIV